MGRANILSQVDKPDLDMNLIKFYRNLAFRYSNPAQWFASANSQWVCVAPGLAYRIPQTQVGAAQAQIRRVLHLSSAKNNNLNFVWIYKCHLNFINTYYCRLWNLEKGWIWIPTDTAPMKMRGMPTNAERRRKERAPATRNIRFAIYVKITSATGTPMRN